MKRIIPKEVGEAIFTIKNYCDKFESCAMCPLYINRAEECFFGEALLFNYWADINKEEIYSIGSDYDE